MTTTTEQSATPALARRLDVLGAEGSFRVAAAARVLEGRGQRVIHLEFGEPDFPAPPHVVEAAGRALREGDTKYAPPPGIAPLRAAIAQAAQARGVPATAEQVIVTSGAKPMLQYAVLAVVEEGDDVLVPDPGFPIYPSLVRLAGGTPRSYPIISRDGAYALDLDALSHAITPRARAIIVNSPHNPTGWVASARELAAVAELALRHNLWVISDEIYDGLTYADVAARSIAAIPGLAGRTLLVDGFSKRYAMTGFRLGFGIVPPSLAAHITTLVINNTSCAPHFVQRAGLAALEGPQTCVSEFCETFRTRRDSFIPALGAVDGVAVPLPAGAFYAFADVRRALRPHGLTAHAFADRLLNEFGVAVLPGTDFGDGGEGFLRYSFAAAPSALAEAVELTRQCVASLGATNHPVGVAS